MVEGGCRGKRGEGGCLRYRSGLPSYMSRRLPPGTVPFGAHAVLEDAEEATANASAQTLASAPAPDSTSASAPAASTFAASKSAASTSTAPRQMRLFDLFAGVDPDDPRKKPWAAFRAKVANERKSPTMHGDSK